MKVTVQVELDDILKNKAVTDLNSDDDAVIEQAKSELPRKKDEVVLPKDEAHVDNLPNANPVVHIVKKGETLKQIAEKYNVSYGELSNHMMSVEGTTSIYPGLKIEIPRHFIDLSQA